MRHFSFAVLSAAWWIAVPIVVIAREPASTDQPPRFPTHVDPQTQVVVAVYTGHDHQVYKAPQVRLDELFSTRMFLWLLSEEIVNELELSSSQRHVLSDLRIQAAHLRNDLTPIIAAAAQAKNQVTDVNVAEAVEKFRKQFQELEELLEFNLTKQQAKRVRELLIRKRWVERGVVASLRDSELIWGDTQQNRWESEVNRLDEIMRKECDEHRATMIGEITKVLTLEQARKLSEIVGEPPKFISRNLELLTWQCRHASRGSQLKFDSHLDEFRRTAYPLGVALSGGLEPLDIGDPLAFQQFMLLCQSGYYGHADILGYQIATIVGQDDDYKAEAKKMRDGQQAIDRQLLESKTLSFTQAMDAKAATVDRFIAWQLSRLESDAVLLPHQITEIQRISVRRNIAQRGLHACLVNGVLGQQVAITDEQGASLLVAARESGDEGRKLTRRLENDVWEAVRGNLNREDQLALESLIGHPPEHLCGAPTFLLSPIVTDRR